MGRAAADTRRRGVARTSEIELRGNLNDAHVLRCVGLPKVGPQNRRAPGRPSIVRSHQSGEIAEYTVSGLYGLTAIGGLRTDFYNHNPAFITPRLHLKYNVNSVTIIRASAGKGYHINDILPENSHLL